jgi:ubiquitin carboxyl-terminal hydrolase 4/11/15
MRCPNDCESDEEEVEMKFDDKSRYGLVGLKNLGNTCFMNSGLQCLSHVIELTNYFLTDKYISEINKENNLGTKGDLSTTYAKLLKQLWMGSDSSVSPTQLKRAIGKHQKMFNGYNQHDSGELVSYLLDGIH